MSAANKNALIKSCFLLSIVLIGCSTNIHQEVVTTDTKQYVQDDVINSSALNDGQKHLFSEALKRDDYQPFGKSVDQIINEQKAYDKQALNQLLKDSRKNLEDSQKNIEKVQSLMHDLDIRPFGIRVLRGEYTPYEDHDIFKFSITNMGLKPISSFQAEISLTNKGGNEIYSGTLQENRTITPGATVFVSIPMSGMENHFDPSLARETSINDVVAHSIVDP